MAVDSLSQGQAALERGAWHEAREHFEAALQHEPRAESWEGLGWAGWWLGDAELTFAARESAYRAYRESGDAGGAARVAGWLAADHLEFRGDEAVGRGWIERARRMLEGVPPGPDHGWVALLGCAFAPDMEHQQSLAREAAELGRELGVADLEALGLALEGSSLVARGRVSEGMRRLDEASAVAAGENLQLPVSGGWTFCCTVSACEGVGDFSRAVQWAEAMLDHSERWGSRQLLGICRSAYGRVLAAGGDWPAAEQVLTRAVDDLQVARPAMVARGAVRLGELRARQGRNDEARALFEQAGPHPMGLVGLGALALEEDDPGEAVDAAERVLRNLPQMHTLERMPALELLVRARAAQGNVAEAEAAAGALERAGAEVGTPYMLGRVRLALAELAAARGDHEGARRAAEDAVDRFGESCAPYECGLARLQLARALLALGRRERAVSEAESARSSFAKLGAVTGVARAEELMTGRGEEAAGPSISELTAREVEVLRLVAQGLSDAEVAERLYLSPHTVHRHVANVRAKLRLPSRAAAVAYAARSGLI